MGPDPAPARHERVERERGEPDVVLPAPAVETPSSPPDLDLPDTGRGQGSPFAPPTHGAAPDHAPAPPPPSPIPPPPPAVRPAPPVLAVAHPHQHPHPQPAGAPPFPVQAPAPSAGTLGVPGAAVLDERSNAVGGAIALLGALLVMVGVLLPWMEVGGEAVSGWRASDDAKILLGFVGVVTVGAALVIGGARSLVLRIGLALVGLATVVVGVRDVLSVSDLPGDVTFGPGLIAVLVGGVLVVVAALLTRHRRFR